MSGGPKGPLSPLQELEVGDHRPPYLLVEKYHTDKCHIEKCNTEKCHINNVTQRNVT